MKAAKRPQLLIVMPAYNEAGVISRVLRELPREHDRVAIDVLVIDDASQDDTAAIARAEQVMVVAHLLNAGSGGATATGLDYARRHNYDYAVTVDADGQHAATDCHNIITELCRDRHDLVIGSRLLNSAGMPWYRVVGNKGLSFITYLMFGLHVTDSQSGLKGFSRHALEVIEIKTGGMEFCSETIWRARQQRLKVTEIPIQAIYTDYSLGKGQSNWNAINIIKNLTKRKILELFDA